MDNRIITTDVMEEDFSLEGNLRPQTLDEYIGQEKTKNTLKIYIEAARQRHDSLDHVLFYGPPGLGKTTLSGIIANEMGVHMKVTSGPAIEKPGEMAAILNNLQEGDILFVDEIHRFNKAQQDAFLPFVEKGSIILIGATTENPSFELNAALLSRCQVFVLNRLNSDDFEELLRRAEKETGRRLPVDDEARELMKATADGDGRYILNLAESVLNYAKEGEVFDRESLLKIIRSRAPVYDKGRDGHYNLISAVHKSLRGSDVDAALYWVARMVAAGEDPKYIFRRLTRFAVEDVSMADPNAVTQAIACWDTYERLGSPEGDLALMQLTVYLATAPKSAGVYKAMHKAFDLAKKTGSLMPPKHILNAPTKLMKELGYNRGYVYDQDLEDGFSGQNYFPDGIGRQKLYFPVERGFEREVKKRVEYFDKLRREKNKNKQQEEDGQ